MLYLHVSTFEGLSFLAVLSEKCILSDGHHDIVDFEIVESRNEAQAWYVRQLRERVNDETKDALHLGDIRSESHNGMRPRVC
jgi:hypothetical protein